MIANFGTPTAGTTLYLGPLEIQNFGGVTTDDNYIDSPHPQVRVVNGVVSYLHQDALGSVILITDGAGAKAREVAYRPYGEILYNGNFLPAVPAEARGFIGERYDAGAGLQYLNARYYDPRLGLFLQPDWFEVTEAGVGTNRYAYAGGDPVNARDPGGNQSEERSFLQQVGDFFSSLFGGSGSQSSGNMGASSNNLPPPSMNSVPIIYGPGQPMVFDPYGGAGWEQLYGPQAAGTLSPTTVEQLGIVAVAGTVISSLPSAAEAAFAGAITSTGTRTFYRAVTTEEARQIAATGTLMPGRNSLEGKWMAETLANAMEWGTRMNGVGASTIVEVTIPLSRYEGIVSAGLYTPRLDGIGAALYVPFERLGDLTVRLMGK